LETSVSLKPTKNKTFLRVYHVFVKHDTLYCILYSSIKTYTNVVSDNNSHNDAIDGHCLAEDDADEVLGLDPGSLHTPAQNAGASCQYSPGLVK